ncbi:hypothetical protein DRO42_04730 [Candidatus Bathyarchaeota archaeon]|nr:MAG: hypothetical protein DRO42_04730 [Candidatus Bathyarchaeota archaeon]
MSEKLSDFLENGKDWGKLKTTVPGVFVLKLPPYKSSPGRLAVEINPVDASGNPTKRRGLIIRSIEECRTFRELLGNEKVENLLEMLEEVNPQTPGRGKRSEEIIEI